jgi:hypothetical protein
MSRIFTIRYSMLLLLLLITATLNAQTLVTVGTGTTTNENAPIYSCSNYSYSEQIYTAAEILAANGGVAPNGQIVNLKFNLSTSSYNSGTGGSDTWTVYVGMTTASNFPSTNAADWIPVSAMTMVHDGQVNFPAPGNWMTIPFDVPFTWDGTSNIVVGVNEYNPGYDCSMLWTSTSTNPNYQTMYSSEYELDVNNLPDADQQLYTRPNIQFQWAQSCSLTTGFPTAGATTATPGNLCVSGNVTLAFTPATALPPTLGISYKWQSGPTATGIYTDIPGAITTTPTYTTTNPISAVTYFKCVMLCNGTAILTSSASNGVTITNPGTVTPTGGSRCGPGSVTLTGVPSISTNTLGWFSVPTGGLAIATGNSFATPYIPVTTTFYVEAEGPPQPTLIPVGTGSLVGGNNFGFEPATQAYPSPFGNYFTANHEQYLIRASELFAAGLSPGSFTSIGFDMTSPYGGGNTLQEYQIQMANTTDSQLTSNLITTGFTNVLPQATVTPPAVTGYNTMTFTTPFTWNGNNVVVDVSFSNAGPSCGMDYTVNGVAHQTATSFVSSHSIYADYDCTINTWTPDQTGDINYQRPNMQFKGPAICASPRQAVIATINASPATSIAQPASLCNNETRALTISSAPMSNYTSYAWTPNVTDLYTTAAATTPYVSGSSPTVYFKSATSGPHTFYVFSSGATAAACTHADTVMVWVQPSSVSIAAAPDSICSSGATNLSLVPATGYASNSVQWQESADGITYADIAGETNPAYTTPTLTTEHYYRALVKSTNDTCEMPTKHIVVVTPDLVSANDSFVCGSGPVVLTASTGGFSTAKWYNAASGGNPIAIGSPFVTPYLGVSQDYYVAAEGGAGVAVPVQDGTDNSTDGGSNYDFGLFSLADNFGMQMLYTADEITTAGGTAGNISSVAFNCTGLPAYAIPNFKVAIKFVPAALTTLNTWQGGMTDVASVASLQPTTTGWITFPFNAVQGWNGTDNIVVQICRDASPFDPSGDHEYTYNPGRTLYYDDWMGTSSCGTAGTDQSDNLPNITFGIEALCATPRTLVHAYVRPKPVVDLGPDMNICVNVGDGYILDAGVQPNMPQFLWNDFSTSQTLAVTENGIYDVKVTNMYTCSSSDTVNVILRRNPVFTLGSDTSVCNGANVTLDPGNVGIEYYWSTGQTSQSIVVNGAGSYNLFVTNAQGCSASDTINVTTSGQLPTIQGIQISNNGQFDFVFSAVNPLNIIGYDWDFGDTTDHSYEAAPEHTYAHSGNYIVVLRLSSTCGFVTDSTSAAIVGIHQISVSNNDLSVYPNPTKNTATISIAGDLKMQKVEVYNVLGQVIYSKDADSNTKHVLDLSRFASGMYTLEIYTDKGTVARKLEVVK